MSSVTRRIIVRIVGIADRCNNISWPDFLEREGGREGRRVMDRSEASQRIRVAAAAYSPRLESSPSSQSMDSARNARNATRRSSGIWPGLLLSVRFAAHACKCIRVYRGSLRSPYHLLPLPLLAPPFELRRSSNRHAATVARENVLVSRYRIYHPLHFPPPVYILPRKGHEIPGLFLYGRIAN